MLLEAYLATLSTAQVVILAWIGFQAKASADERHYRRQREGLEE